MTPQDFKNWRTDLGFTKIKAAEELGISRQQIMNYERGHKGDHAQTPVIIPRYIELACAALQSGITGYSAPANQTD